MLQCICIIAQSYHKLDHKLDHIYLIRDLMQFLFGRIVHTVESDHLAVDFDWRCHKGIDTLRFQPFIDGFACFFAFFNVMDDDIVGFLILCKPCFNDAFIRYILQVIFFFGYARFAPLVGVVKRSAVILFKDVRSIGGHTLSDILHQLIQYFVRIFF